KRIPERNFPLGSRCRGVRNVRHRLCRAKICWWVSDIALLRRIRSYKNFSLEAARLAVTHSKSTHFPLGGISNCNKHSPRFSATQRLSGIQRLERSAISPEHRNEKRRSCGLSRKCDWQSLLGAFGRN